MMQKNKSVNFEISALPIANTYDSPKIRNLPKIFLRSFENVAPVL